MILKPVSKESPLPLYYQIKESIQECILAGSIKPGEKLPSEAQLAEMLRVSLITVRRALTDLQINGFVTKVHGRGTFVLEKPMEQELDHLSGFSENMEELKRTSMAKIFRIRHIPATEEVSRHLAIPLAEEVIEIERIRYADKEPVMFNLTFLPKYIGEKIIKEDLETMPIFKLIEKGCGVPLVEADYQLEAAIFPEYIQKALGLSINLPALLVRRTSYTTGQRPIDYTQLYYRSDRFRYAVHVQRGNSVSAATQVERNLKMVS